MGGVVGRRYAPDTNESRDGPAFRWDDNGADGTCASTPTNHSRWRNIDMEKASKPPFKAVHPTLVVLQAVVEQIAEARRRYSHALDWVNRLGSDIDPVHWTTKIEAALADHDQRKLDGLQSEYDEKAITFLSALIAESTARRKFFNGRLEISNAITAVVEAHNAIPERSDDAWMRPIMEGACIFAAQEHGADPDQPRIQGRYELSQNGFENSYNSSSFRAEKIMYAAFCRLADWLCMGTCNPVYYPTDLVVQGCKVAGLEYLNRDVELRHVYAVDFVDCVNDTHPASVLLKELLDKLEKALEEAREASKALRSEHNGAINERNYAGRLVTMLHDEGRGDGSKFQAQVDAQNERRWVYELERRNYLVALKNLKKAHEAVVQALRAAVAEGRPLVDLTRQPSSATVCITVDKYETGRIIMNNCLAADLRLRAIGREMKELDSVLSADLSSGAGARALAQKYSEVARRYKRWETTVTAGAAADSQGGTQ